MIHRRARGSRLSFGDIRDRRLGENLSNGAGGIAEYPCRAGANRPVEQLDQLQHCQLRRGTRERVTPFDPPLGAKDPGPPEDREQLLEELRGDVTPAR